MNEPKMMLEIDHLAKKYEGQVDAAVKDISLHVPAGVIFGLLGLNGAGKTTTFQAVSGILRFDQGTIKINGFDIEKEPLKAKQSLSYIPDDSATFEELTGREYIRFMADMYGVSVADRTERTERFAKMFAMEKFLDIPIRNYSHGMQQKIAIMGGVIHYPPLWILDEPLIGLDPISLNEIKAFMREYVEAGRTIIFSSHVLELVTDLCSHVAIIDRGKVIGEYRVGSEVDLAKKFNKLARR